MIKAGLTGSIGMGKSTTAQMFRDEGILSEYVIGNPDNMKKLEAIIHPLVHKKEQEFLKEAETRGDKLVVLDIPLLFETGGVNRVDKIIVVTAPADVQRERVLARDCMTEEKFESILVRQVPDSEKREKADFLIDTSLGLEAANEKVREIISCSQFWLYCNKIPL